MRELNLFRNLFLRIGGHLDKNIAGIIFVNAMYKGNFAYFVIRNGGLFNNYVYSVVRILRCFRIILELKTSFLIGVSNVS